MPIFFFIHRGKIKLYSSHTHNSFTHFLVNIDIFGVRKWEATSENLDVSPYPGTPPLTCSALIAPFQLFVSVLSRVIL